MKIGIMSDSHDNIDNLKKAISIFNKEKAELVIHCGDWVAPSTPDFCSDLNCKIISVFGNCDGDIYRFLTRHKKNDWNVEFHNKVAELDLSSRKIAVFHGDSKPLLNSLIGCQEYDAVFSGHTHLALKEVIGKTLHLNPGCLSGYERTNKVKPSIAFYDTNTGKAEIITF